MIAYTDPFLVYFYFTMYSVALIFMMFAISTFLNNGEKAFPTSNTRKIMFIFKKNANKGTLKNILT